jgi:ATP-dependent protease HslVU (ClpYQ) peptidase subunit
MSNIKFSQLPNLGNLTAATIVPVVASGVNYSVTMANLQAYTSSTTGNVTAGYFLGNGSQLTGLPATYSNANVTTLMASFGSNTISTTGNVTTGYIFGNGSQLTGIAASYGNANVNTLLSAWGSNTLSTTGNVTAGNLRTSGQVSATGNVTGTYILGNGSLLTGLAGNYGNSNVTTLLAGFGSNTISTSGTVTAGAVSTTGNVTAGNVNTGGNVSGNYILGNGSLLTGLAGNYGNPNVVSLLSAFGSNTISTTGNITSGNLNTGGNVTGAFIKGSGSQLTGVVTSISAGTGISINQSTGAVTVTATGSGGGGNSISNGTSNISIPVANGNININTNAAAGIYTIIGNSALFTGTASFTTNGLTSGISGQIAGGQLSWPGRANFTGNFSVPTYTIATKPTIGNQQGDIISISNSPTYSNRLAYWSAGTTWRYVSDNTAV